MIPLARVTPPACSKTRLPPVCILLRMPPKGIATRLAIPCARNSRSRSPDVWRATSMLDTFATREMSATIVTASKSGMCAASDDQSICIVLAAANGDQIVSDPSEWKYQPCSGPEIPKLRSAIAPVTHIVRSAAGMANGDLTQRRSARSTANVPRALASFATSRAVHPLPRLLKCNARPSVIRMPPTTRNQPVTAKNPPTTKYGTHRKYVGHRSAPGPYWRAPHTSVAALKINITVCTAVCALPPADRIAEPAVVLSSTRTAPVGESMPVASGGNEVINAMHMPPILLRSEEHTSELQSPCNL